uniref:GPN-loop GTPase 2 n=2 Tax=Cyprinus carpio TaxID=7962 RepID=A0A8C1AQQ5_CYPCA
MQVICAFCHGGKTTYCRGMQEFLSHLGRKVVVVNLDPANEGLPYPCAVDISELVTLDDVMDGLKLGPNGGLIYSMEYLEANLDWLENKLKHHHGCYFLFDCPGQVELYFVLFFCLSLQEKESMMQVLRTVDKANGYFLLLLFAVVITLSVQEKYMEATEKTVKDEVMDL